MTEQLAESWHHECLNPECGIMMTVAFEREGGGREPMPAPSATTPCPICGGEWGPWIAGDAPEYEDDPALDDEEER